MAEKVIIFTKGNWQSYKPTLEDSYNKWIQTMGDKIEIIDRQFRLAAATGSEVCHVQSIAVFYRERKKGNK